MATSDRLPPPPSDSAGTPTAGEIPQDTAEVLSFPSVAEPVPLPPLHPSDRALQDPAEVLGPSHETPRATRFLLVLLLAALAFFLASFPARNSDAWLHLAAGKALAAGDFSFAQAGSVVAGLPVNRAWLYDLFSYGLYKVLGGSGLVFLKAVLVIGLALLVLRLSRTGQGWTVPALCTALALLAMSTRLFLQPATVSYFFLALTLWFLRPSAWSEQSKVGSWLPPWPLLVLFGVWVNTDAWFVLGLVIVALTWLGRVLDYVTTVEGRLRSLARYAASLAVLAAACLLNPYLADAFALPPEVGSLLGGPSGTPLGSAPVFSPFQKAYYANLGTSPAIWAYLPLLGLGLLSFVLNLPRWSWERLLPWGAVALLSAYQARAVPFFAVVAGPVLAWNLQEYLAQRARESAGGHWAWRVNPALWGALAVLLCTILVVCAWPGWLQAPPYEPRRWAVETAPSLERGAAVTRRWHEEKKLRPETRGLHLSPETAYAFAWFCPEDKGLLDNRLAATLLGESGEPGDGTEPLRAAGVNHVIVYDPDHGRLSAALARFLAEPERWSLLFLEGDLAVFGWRDPATAKADDPFRGWELDLHRLAFRPAADKKAPRERPDREAEVRPWWEAFWKPAPPRPIDRDEALLHWLHAEALRGSAPYRNMAAWEAAEAAALVGAGAAWTGPAGLVDAHIRRVLLRPEVAQPGSSPDSLPVLDRLAAAYHLGFAQQRDDTPPALLYLAVRSARRALAANPADAQAHLVLGESYLRLHYATRERLWGQRMPQLVQLRQAQASAALNRAVALKPDLARAQFSLGTLYQAMGCLDLALNHYRAYQKVVRESGGRQGAVLSPEEDVRFQENVSRLAKEVERRENQFLVAAANLRVSDRAQAAAENGLAGKARDLLLQSDVSAFGQHGTALELELLLQTGRVKDVLEWSGEEQKEALGPERYHWLQVRALAAAGDYALAEKECAQLASPLAAGTEGQEAARSGDVLALMIGQAVLDQQGLGTSIPDLVWRGVRRVEFMTRVMAVARNLQKEADATVLRGLLALEAGEVEEAEVAFRVALSIWKDESTAASGAGLDFSGRVVAQECLRWLE